jgi:hypothetical protein
MLGCTPGGGVLQLPLVVGGFLSMIGELFAGMAAQVLLQEWEGAQLMFELAMQRRSSKIYAEKV